MGATELLNKEPPVNLGEHPVFMQWLTALERPGELVGCEPLLLSLRLRP
jgi:hypothetical protein